MRQRAGWEGGRRNKAAKSVALHSAFALIEEYSAIFSNAKRPQVLLGREPFREGRKL
jgi:hypothetical protein